MTRPSPPPDPSLALALLEASSFGDIGASESDVATALPGAAWGPDAEARARALLRRLEVAGLVGFEPAPVPGGGLWRVTESGWAEVRRIRTEGVPS